MYPCYNIVSIDILFFTSSRRFCGVSLDSDGAASAWPPAHRTETAYGDRGEADARPRRRPYGRRRCGRRPDGGGLGGRGRRTRSANAVRFRCRTLLGRGGYFSEKSHAAPGNILSVLFLFPPPPQQPSRTIVFFCFFII